MNKYRRLSDVLDLVLDERVGLIGYVVAQDVSLDSPGLFRFVARACDTGAFAEQSNFSATGGAAASREAALAKAVGEAIERYCPALFRASDLPLSSAAEADFETLDPSAFALSSTAQYDSPGFVFSPFTRDTPVRWTEATDLSTGRVVWVPAAMVFIPYTYYQGSGEAPICQPISTGLACHVGTAETALSGLCEVLERDAFTITWQAQMSPPKIRPASLDQRSLELIHQMEAAGSEVTLLNITTDLGVPTLMAVQRHRSAHTPPITVAAATEANPEAAANKSLEELSHTMRYMQSLMDTVPKAEWDYDSLDFSVINQETHLQFWCDHRNVDKAGFLLESSQEIDLDEIPSLGRGAPHLDLASITEKVQAKGYQVLISDLTSPDVRSLGLRVHRVIVPGLHPLFMGHRYRALGGTRLWEVPQMLGHRGRTRAEGDNPWPHPFP